MVGMIRGLKDAGGVEDGDELEIKMGARRTPTFVAYSVALLRRIASG